MKTGKLIFIIIVLLLSEVASFIFMYSLVEENKELKFQIQMLNEMTHNKKIEYSIGDKVYLKPDSTEAIVISKGGFYREDGAYFNSDYTIEYKDTSGIIQQVGIKKEFLY